MAYLDGAKMNKNKIMKKSDRLKLKKKSNKYKFIQISKKPNPKFTRCVICESNGYKDEKDLKKIPCFLFDGELICEVCCKYEVNCAREDSTSLDAAKRVSGLNEQEIYNKCMRCQHSEKMGLYNLFELTNRITCYFAESPKKKKDALNDKNKKIREDIKCKLFNQRCVYYGNSKECESGAWCNAALIIFRQFIETELDLRGIDADVEVDDFFDLY